MGEQDMIKRTRLMSQAILFRTYNRFKNEPKMSFAMSDFQFADRLDKVYIDTLVKFGFVEEVKLYWTTGPKQGSLRSTFGYRWVNNKKNKMAPEIPEVLIEEDETPPTTQEIINDVLGEETEELGDIPEPTDEEIEEAYKHGEPTDEEIEEAEEYISKKEKVKEEMEGTEEVEQPELEDDIPEDKFKGYTYE